MRRYLVLFLILLLPLQQVEAGALAYTGRIGKAVGNSIKNTGKRLGFAANDPRYLKTWDAVNDAAFDGLSAGAVVGTIAGIAGAPVWGTLVIVVGVGLAVGYVAYKANQEEVLWHDGGQVTIKPTVALPPPIPFDYVTLATQYSIENLTNYFSCISIPGGYGQNSEGSCYAFDETYFHRLFPSLDETSTLPGVSQWKYKLWYNDPQFGADFYGMTSEEVIQRVFLAENIPIARCRVFFSYYGPNAGPFPVDSFQDCGTNDITNYYHLYNRMLPNAHPDTMSGSFLRIIKPNTPYNSMQRNTDGTLNPCSTCTDYQIINNTDYIPSSPETDFPEKIAPFMDPGANEPLDEKVIVKLANELWKRAAAQPGYEGIPYDAVNPVTVADVQLYKAENPVAYPTQADMLSPAAPTVGAKPNFNPDQAVPNSPAPEPNPNPDQPPGTVIINNPAPNVQVTVNVPAPIVNVNPKVDFGDYPDNGPPDLTGTPTETSIINAIKNQVLPASDFEDSHPAGSCPTPEFTVFDTTFVIDSHCSIFDSIAPIFVTVMSAVWAMLAFFIVMRA